MNNPVIECRNITLIRDERPVLEDVSLALNAGEATVVHGVADLSDTLLLRMFALLEPPDRGELRFEHRPVDWRRDRDLLVIRKKVAYIPQVSALISNLTILDNITLFHRYHYNRSPAEANRNAMPLVERFGLSPFSGVRPADVEPEYRKRAVIVREFLKECVVGIIDHLRTALSVQGLEIFLDFLDEEKRRTSLALLISEDDPFIVERVSDRTVFIEEGRIKEESKTGLRAGRNEDAP